MENLFKYNNFVTGPFFISRQNEVKQLMELIESRRNIVIYEPPKSGKNSLLREVERVLSKKGQPVEICTLNLYNLRTPRQFLKSYTNALLNHCALKGVEPLPKLKEQIERVVKEVGDIDCHFSNNDTTPPPQALIEEVIELPETIYTQMGISSIIYIKEFQEILKLEDKENLLSILDRLLPLQSNTKYIITGSMVNSMKYIFEEVKYLYNFAKRVKLAPLLVDDLTHHFQKQFLKTGRVISTELASNIHSLVEGHPWYAQQLGEIAYAHTRGFLTHDILQDSFDSLLQLHSYRYQIITSNLSRYQISFLKAVLDGVSLFSSSQVIKEYSLRSSANVKRQKESFKKKEILTEEGGKMLFLDPLFKIWLKEHYFKF